MTNTFVQNQINWFEIKPPNTLDSRTLFINPQANASGSTNPITEVGATSAFCGIGFNRALWDADTTLGIYESVTYRVVCTNPGANTTTPTFSGFSFISYWINSSSRPTGAATQSFGDDEIYISVCTHVDITVYRMDSNIFDVYYQAYAYTTDPAIGTGGTSGYFQM
jgi:hypothetical protein